MGKFIRIGNNAIQIDSILSAQYITIEYPYMDDSRYDSEKAANIYKGGGGIFSLLGALCDLSNTINGSFEMRQVEILQLKFLTGGNTEIIWLYNDSDFSASLGKIVDTYERVQKTHSIFNTNGDSSSVSRYENACRNFIDNSPAIYPAGESLDGFLSKLTAN